MAGVKPGRDVFGTHDRDVLGQAPVEREGQAPGWVVRFGLKVGDVPERVHAGVGTRAPIHVRRVPAYDLDRGFQRSLHGARTRLALPTLEGSALVLEIQTNVAHVLT
jgi:hypothetical protein